MTSYDVVIVGAGPVGLGCAIEAALRGRSVVVLDPRADPIDKACGEGLMPGAVQALDRLGVRPAGQPLAGIAYVDGRHQARHSFAAGPGLGVRRTELQRALAARAAELGVVRVDQRVEDVEQDAATVRAGGVHGRWLLACDGLHSPVRRRLGLDRPTTGRRRFGLRRHAAMAPWSNDVEVHWGPLGEAYVTPVAPDLVGVAVLSSSGLGFDELMASFPGLRARLDEAPWLTAARGAGPLRQRSRSQATGPVLLVGDAAGYVDALTGEGIRVGLACARAAVDAVEAGDASSYPAQWRRLTRGYRVLTEGLLLGTRPPIARRHIVGAAARLPWLYGRAVEALAG